MKKKYNIKSKLNSLEDKSNDSRNSKSGYYETGNPVEVHAKARAMRNNDNGSH